MRLKPPVIDNLVGEILKYIEEIDNLGIYEDDITKDKKFGNGFRIASNAVSLEEESYVSLL